MRFQTAASGGWRSKRAALRARWLRAAGSASRRFARDFPLPAGPSPFPIANTLPRPHPLPPPPNSEQTPIRTNNRRPPPRSMYIFPVALCRSATPPLAALRLLKMGPIIFAGFENNIIFVFCYAAKMFASRSDSGGVRVVISASEACTRRFFCVRRTAGRTDRLGIF